MNLEELKSKVWIMEKHGAAHFVDPKTGICACGWKPSLSTLEYMEQVDPKAVIFLGHKVCYNCANSVEFKYSVKERVQLENLLLDPKSIKSFSIYKQWIQNLIVVTRLHMEGNIESTYF